MADICLGVKPWEFGAHFSLFRRRNLRVSGRYITARASLVPCVCPAEHLLRGEGTGTGTDLLLLLLLAGLRGVKAWRGPVGEASPWEPRRGFLLFSSRAEAGLDSSPLPRRQAAWPGERLVLVGRLLPREGAPRRPVDLECPR